MHSQNFASQDMLRVWLLKHVPGEALSEHRERSDLHTLRSLVRIELLSSRAEEAEEFKIRAWL